jgi:hypothetical protein
MEKVLRKLFLILRLEQRKAKIDHYNESTFIWSKGYKKGYAAAAKRLQQELDKYERKL